MEPLSPFYIPQGPQPQSEYVGVPQRGFAITSASAAKHILFTSRVAPCFTITLYDRETSTGALAHIDTGILVKESVDKLTKNFTKKGIDLSRLEVQIIGGHSIYETCKVQLLELESAFGLLTDKVTKLVFTKKPLDQLAKERFGLLQNNLAKVTDREEKEAVLKEIHSLTSSVGFSQIALDTRTGTVSITSDVIYSIKDPTKCTAYTEKGSVNTSRFWGIT